MTILLFQSLLFAFYVTFVVKKHGILKSISDSWYQLGNKYNWMFTILFAFPIGVLNMLHGNIWFVLAGSFLTFVGAAAAFRDRITSIVHNIGAIGSIILSLVGLGIMGVFWPIIPIILGFILIKKNKTWWVEIIAFIAIMLGLLQTYL